MSNVVEESKHCVTEKMERSKFIRLTDHEILNLLKGIYKDLKLFRISTSWRINTKDDLLAEGENGNVIVKLTK